MIILVDMDKVTINGTVLLRPSRTSRSAWMKFWDVAQLRSERL